MAKKQRKYRIESCPGDGIHGKRYVRLSSAKAAVERIYNGGRHWWEPGPEQESWVWLAQQWDEVWTDAGIEAL